MRETGSLRLADPPAPAAPRGQALPAPAAPARRALHRVIYLQLALLWLIVLVAAWGLYLGDVASPSDKHDCATTRLEERVRALQKKGYQIVSDETGDDGERLITLCH